MPIMNYTTTVSPEKTAQAISDLLRKAGARSVLLEYLSDGRLDFISFRIDTPIGAMFFKLPARVDGVRNAMRKDKKISASAKNEKQAERVAWRIVKDWVEVQLALVESEQAELEQVFLPYAQAPNGKTFFELFKEREFPALTHNSEA